MSFENFFGEAEFSYEAEKKSFIDNMDFLKEMSVQEIILVFFENYYLNQQKNM